MLLQYSNILIKTSNRTVIFKYTQCPLVVIFLGRQRCSPSSDSSGIRVAFGAGLPVADRLVCEAAASARPSTLAPMATTEKSRSRTR